MADVHRGAPAAVAAVVAALAAAGAHRADRARGEQRPGCDPCEARRGGRSEAELRVGRADVRGQGEGDQRDGGEQVCEQAAARAAAMTLIATVIYRVALEGTGFPPLARPDLKGVAPITTANRIPIGDVAKSFMAHGEDEALIAYLPVGSRVQHVGGARPGAQRGACRAGDVECRVVSSGGAGVGAGAWRGKKKFNPRGRCDSFF
eukprot:6760455-Prymnesium_polylepis.1